MKLRIFTDGACSGNPGPGGWATLFALPERNEVISGHAVGTTNNRMELLAVIEGLEHAIEEGWDNDEMLVNGYSGIEIHSDSAYVVNALEKGWLTMWQKNHWQTSKGEPVKNYDLWQRLLRAMNSAKALNIDVAFVKVKGHNGVCLNEIVDTRARSEALIAKKEAEGYDCW